MIDTHCVERLAPLAHRLGLLIEEAVDGARRSKVATTKSTTGKKSLAKTKAAQKQGLVRMMKATEWMGLYDKEFEGLPLRRKTTA